MAVSPAVSDDLLGGDTVTITGTNFLTAGVANVTFGGMPATNRVILSETEMTVQTPPAPGGIAQAVNVVVATLHGGTEQIVDGYTYAVSGPNPQSISPLAFTPTGAEDFTITGTTLGPLGGSVTVTFAGIGSVTGAVSANGQAVTGRAPVSDGVPPLGPVTVTLDTGVATADVPQTVAYAYTGPLPIAAGVPGQALGNASQPVRLADGFAALCTSGTDAIWGNANDEIRIVRGPPNAVQILSVSLRAAPGLPVGFLDPNNSIPAVLGPDTFCVYAAGGAAGPGYILVTLARTAPVADYFGQPGINAAPIATISPNRIGFM
ncbi:MAG TPA: IPT/TIG domain-containing protein, partial [Burkholderiales bacterium]|nr:IPT/TIG domain-containing protein [Burkholderiales bacterium]